MARIAIVGLGFMGKTHIGAYSRVERAEIAAICDARQEALHVDLAAPGGNIKTAHAGVDLAKVEKYTDYDAMLSAGGFDAVDVCLPTPHHEPAVVKALKAGYHVICEKPMAPSVEATERMIAVSRKTGRLFSVAHCLRFWPAYSEVKKIAESGKYGRILSADFSRFSHLPGWSVDNWLLDVEQSGGPTLDLHIHDTDMVLYLFGLPRSLRSSGTIDESGVLSQICTQFFYDNVTATASGGWIKCDSYGFNMRAYYVLEEAIIDMDFSKQPILTVYPNGGEKFAPELPEQDGYYFELKDFVEGIEKGRLSEVVSPQSAADSVKVCLLEERSARAGRELSMEP